MVEQSKNTLYNQDVAEIFIALIMSRGFSIRGLDDKDIEQFTKIAIALSANKPQVY